MSASKKYDWDYCTFSPEKLFGVYIGDPCCKAHDEAYCLEGNIKTQLEADENLKICIAEKFLAYAHSIWLAKFVGRTYYVGVRLFGWTQWKTWSKKGPQPTKKEKWLQRWTNIKWRTKRL